MPPRKGAMPPACMNDARAFVFCLWALNQKRWGPHQLDRSISGGSPLRALAPIVFTLTRSAARPAIAKAVLAGDVEQLATQVPWRVRAPGPGRKIVALSRLVEDATAAGFGEVPRAAALAKKTLSCMKRGSGATPKEPAEAAPAPPQQGDGVAAYVQGYAGPLGRVEAVQQRFQLGEEDAAQLVRSADGLSQQVVTVREPEPESVLVAELSTKLDRVTRELANERVLTRALRTVLSKYMPTDLATGAG